MNRVVHIIEYKEKGTLWKLITPLLYYEEHELIESQEKRVPLNEKNKIYVFHTSGRLFPMVSNLENFLLEGFKCVCFIHTLPDYIIAKNCHTFLDYMKDLQNKFSLLILVPSMQAKELYYKCGIRTKVVELGIPTMKIIEDDRLDIFVNKIVTVATNLQKEYLMAKGIDVFSELMKKMGLENQAIILGLDCNKIYDIECIKLERQQMGYVLANSMMYVQLSRSESFNITSAEARQLMLPMVLSNTGGHINSINKNSLVNNMCEAEMKIKEIMRGEYDKNAMLEVFRWSKANENVESFRSRINRAIFEIK